MEVEREIEEGSLTTVWNSNAKRGQADSRRSAAESLIFLKHQGKHRKQLLLTHSLKYQLLKLLPSFNQVKSTENLVLFRSDKPGVVKCGRDRKGFGGQSDVKGAIRCQDVKSQFPWELGQDTGTNGPVLLRSATGSSNGHTEAVSLYWCFLFFFFFNFYCSLYNAGWSWQEK